MTDNWTPNAREHQRLDWKKIAKQRWLRIADLLIENERLRFENERLLARQQPSIAPCDDAEFGCKP